MKQFYLLTGVILLTMTFSCDKYEKESPEPVELSFTNPGIVEFKVQQMSTGQKPNLEIDTMRVSIINQSNSDLLNVAYVIRGFNENKKEFAYFSYWQDRFYNKLMKSYAGDYSEEISKNFNNIISYDNMEVDLISYKTGNRTIKHKYSDSYKGNYAVYRDTVFQAFGAQYSWIAYNGKVTTYFDRGDFPWISFRGQIVNDTIVYGDIQMIDKKVSVSSPVNDSLGFLYFSFEFKSDFNEPYYLNLSLVKN